MIVMFVGFGIECLYILVNYYFFESEFVDFVLFYDNDE